MRELAEGGEENLIVASKENATIHKNKAYNKELQTTNYYLRSAIIVTTLYGHGSQLLITSHYNRNATSILSPLKHIYQGSQVS